MTKKEIAERSAAIIAGYSCYKVGNIAAKLWEHGVSDDDISYIMRDGEDVKLNPRSKLRDWLDGAMDRMEERLSMDLAKEIRQSSACSLTGKRDALARNIYKSNPDVDSRFEALSRERGIIGGNAWKESGDYYITFWYAKPESGYTCGCLRDIPEKPMNKLWCECCAGHIRHHFETALGVRAKCDCVTSVLSSCGEDACLFRLNIIEELPKKK